MADSTVLGAPPRYRGVFSHYIENEGILVIEWSNVELLVDVEENEPVYVDLSFQILLFDPGVYSTPTGDGEIVFQYKEFHSYPGLRYQNPYSTVGIRNLDGSGGVEYAYWNEYPDQAHPIENEFAIKFTTADLYEAGGVAGRVVRLEDQDNGISDAIISLLQPPGAITDEDGNFSIGNIRP
ncbi:MAG: hypothetical protein P9M15_05510, partial [Candidatus Electryoneaceae bacterium]|nr:hypothetical protein [Candidatus Electryoneaceae bacterium]